MVSNVAIYVAVANRILFNGISSYRTDCRYLMVSIGSFSTVELYT